MINNILNTLPTLILGILIGLVAGYIVVKSELIPRSIMDTKIPVIRIKDRQNNIASAVVVRGGYLLSATEPVEIMLPTATTIVDSARLSNGLYLTKLNKVIGNFAKVAKELSQGQSVDIIGNHFNLNRSVLSTNIAGFRMLQDKEIAFVLIALKNTSLGSGIFNKKGELVGIVSKINLNSIEITLIK